MPERAIDVTLPPDRLLLNRQLRVGDEILGRYVVRAELGQGETGCSEFDIIFLGE